LQPSYELTHHPVDLRSHGLNPHGQPLYRVIWADTRKSKVIHRGKVHILPRYFHGDENNAAGHWVLEKWAPAEIIIGMTHEQYDAFLASTKDPAAEEYPSTGDYELSYVFEGNVDEVFLQKQLSMHEFRHRKMNLTDRKLEMEAAEDKKEKVADEKFDELYEVAREETLCQ